MKVHTTNYTNAFISIAEDCPIHQSEIPMTKNGKETIATLQFDLIIKHPYKFTSDEILVDVFMKKNDFAQQDFEHHKEVYFAKAQACLRCSPLSKRYGWGIHFDRDSKVAIYSIDSKEYHKFESDTNLFQTKAMRSKKS